MAKKANNKQQGEGVKAPQPSVPKPKKEKDFFKINGSTNRRFALPNGDIVDLRFGVPSNALELFKQGKEWLGLKEGAHVLFKDLSNQEIHNLIAKCKHKEDKAILRKALKK